jgi:3-dehydroquinate synthase
MDAIERTLRAGWRHRVLFTDHVFDPANPGLKDILAGDGLSGPGKTLVVLDDSLAAAQPGLAAKISTYFAAHSVQLCLATKPMLQPGGEPAKNSWSGVFRLHQAIDRHHLDRHCCLVAVGGGAMLDVAGLAAATAHRGVRYVRITTTTLSQCDAGVGVKNGINAFGKKNFIGELTDVAAQHPDVVARLQKLAQEMDADLGMIGDGPGVRPADRVAKPQPLLKRVGAEYD